MRSKLRWLASVVALSTVLYVGCFSFAVDYSAPKALLEPQKGAISRAIQALDQGKERDALEQLSALQVAVAQARAMLTGTSFAGDSNTLTDPFTLPEGAYRATIRTAGFVTVKVIPLSAPEDYDLLFNLSRGNADGASTIYVSDNSSIMLEFGNIGEPYEFWFERLN